MKKLLVIFIDLLVVLTLALLVASCGGGGGGGGGDDYVEPTPEPTPVPEEITPVQNENSVLEIKAPTYSDRNPSITNSPEGTSFLCGTSVTFTAAEGYDIGGVHHSYESYKWYVGDVLQTATGNTLALDTSSLSGPCHLMLIVSDDEGNYFSSQKNFAVTAAN